MNARDRIIDILEQDFDGTEYFLVDVKQSGTKYQVFIDSDDKISIDQCARVSRKLESVLEEENLVPERYTLEVSSPGMFNPLKKKRQYNKRIGNEFDIWTNDNTHYRGKLIDVNEENIVIEKAIKEKKKVVGTEEVSIPFSEIKKATLVFSFKNK